MKAIDARELTKNSVHEEIKIIESLIEVECIKGETRLTIHKISAGAYAYFLDNGYEIDSYTIMGEERTCAIIRW